MQTSVDLIESYLHSLRWIARDTIIRYCRRPLAYTLFIVSIAFRITRQKPKEQSFLFLANRVSNSELFVSYITRHFERLINLNSKAPESSSDDYSWLSRCVILKPPECLNTGIRKGVLLIKFTETFDYVLDYLDIQLLLRYFIVVLEPSWSGYCLPNILRWSAFNTPIFIQASEIRDRELLKRLNCGLIPLEIGASDWVDHRIFRPMPLQKQYDVLYIANMNPIKRVHLFLKALASSKKEGRPLNGCLVLASWGGDKQILEHLIRFYGLSDDEQLAVFYSLDKPSLNQIINRSKSNVLLSLKEGSNKTLFESMFAGTPVIALKANVGVNKNYINQFTGSLVEEKDLLKTMRRMAVSGEQYKPRQWAMQNIAPTLTIAKLVMAINKEFPGINLHANELLTKVNAPEAKYLERNLRPIQNYVNELLLLFRPRLATEPLIRVKIDEFRTKLTELRNPGLYNRSIKRTPDPE